MKKFKIGWCGGVLVSKARGLANPVRAVSVWGSLRVPWLPPTDINGVRLAGHCLYVDRNLPQKRSQLLMI